MECGCGIARENELGTLEQLNVTPMTKVQFIAAKLIPFWLLSLVIFSMGLAIGKLVFGIPTRVLVRGAGIETVGAPILGLAVGGVAVLSLAVLRYRKSTG